jgi:hypothetical protein
MSQRKLRKLKEKKFQTEHLMEMLEGGFKATTDTYGAKIGAVMRSEDIKAYAKLKEKLFQINHKIELVEGVLEEQGETKK